MRYTVSAPAAVLALLLTAACDSSNLVSPDPGAGEGAVKPVAPGSQMRTPDDEFARVARAEVPGFAGYYLQDDGTPVVRLVDASKSDAARRYLAQHLTLRMGRNKAGLARTPIVKPAAYDFAQLKGWADGLHPMLNRTDVFTIDVDEKENRVTVGVENAGAISAVRAEALRLGIPGAALFVKTEGRPEKRNVQALHNPVYGGIQIAFLSGGAEYVCTLGFNATRVATQQSIFVTNSHCTPTYFGFDGGPIYQPIVAPGNLIGNEVADVAPYNCGIAPTPCRRSDAAYIGHNGTRGTAQGLIARTAWPNPISTTEIGQYEIWGRLNGNLPVGTWLDKTGRTSGSTYGQIQASCVSIGNLRCQDVSSIFSAGGDSGSPVYYYLGGTGDAENDVLLRGILWGGPSNNYNITYSSPLAGIEYDLGVLNNLCVPAAGC